MGVQVKTLYLNEGGDTISTHLRPFYSFNWGGKDIEEFNLVATLDKSSGLQKGLYSGFEDTVKNYIEVHGQQYYRTTISANVINFRLATDGMTERELTDFVNFFRPGKIEYLTLAEHPYRKILARVAQAPEIEMVPFEMETQIVIANKTIDTVTTEYKGFIDLSFVMDYPFWESSVSFFDGELTEEKAKVIAEDGIPYVDAVNGDIILGEGTISIGAENKGYLYYCGTAPSYPIIDFSLNMKLNDSGYVNTIGNNYSINPNDYLEIGKNKMFFTLPGLFSSYNEALGIINDYENGDSYEDLMIDIRENIVDYYMRAAVIEKLNKPSYNNNGAFTNKNDLIDDMKSLIGKGIDVHFTFDCGKGLATMICDFNGHTIDENCGDMLLSRFISIDETNFYNASGYIDIEGCTEIKSSIAIDDLTIKYKYMYL